MMFGLTKLRLFGGLAIIAGIIAAAIWLTATLREKDRLADVETRALACEAAVKKGGDTVISCPQAISDAATRAQRYLACDAALKAGDLYAVRAACSAAAKVRDAQATALAADKADLARQLAEANDAIAGAMTRADARTQTLTRKDRNAAAALAAAPRRPDGRITCDDRCLRDLAGD